MLSILANKNLFWPPTCPCPIGRNHLEDRWQELIIDRFGSQGIKPVTSPSWHIGSTSQEQTLFTRWVQMKGVLFNEFPFLLWVHTKSSNYKIKKATKYDPKYEVWCQLIRVKAAAPFPELANELRWPAQSNLNASSTLFLVSFFLLVIVLL